MSNDDTAIRVENLSKLCRTYPVKPCFHGIGAREEGYKTFCGAIADIALAPLRRPQDISRLSRFSTHEHQAPGIQNPNSPADSEPDALGSVPAGPGDFAEASSSSSSEASSSSPIWSSLPNGSAWPISSLSSSAASSPQSSSSSVPMSNDDTVIRVESISKLYRVGAREEGYKTFREAVTDIALAPLKRLLSVSRLSKFKGQSLSSSTAHLSTTSASESLSSADGPSSSEASCSPVVL